MSVRLMSEVFALDIPPGEKLLLLAMADFCADDGRSCFALNATLAKKTSLSAGAVAKFKRQLLNRGLIEGLRISRGRRASEYRVTVNRAHNARFNRAPPEVNRAPRALQPRTTCTPAEPYPYGTVNEPKKSANLAHDARLSEKQRLRTKRNQEETIRYMERSLKNPSLVPSERKRIAGLIQAKKSELDEGSKHFAVTAKTQGVGA